MSSMDHREYKLTIFVVTAIASVVTLIALTIGYVSMKSYERDAVIEADAQIQQTTIREDKKTERSKVHLQWLPWNKEVEG